jgi:hypothetical protein
VVYVTELSQTSCVSPIRRPATHDCARKSTGSGCSRPDIRVRLLSLHSMARTCARVWEWGKGRCRPWRPPGGKLRRDDEAAILGENQWVTIHLLPTPPLLCTRYPPPPPGAHTPIFEKQQAPALAATAIIREVVLLWGVWFASSMILKRKPGRVWGWQRTIFPGFPSLLVCSKT